MHELGVSEDVQYYVGRQGWQHVFKNCVTNKAAMLTVTHSVNVELMTKCSLPEYKLYLKND